MKKFTWIFGLIASFLILAGVFFKILHWPGASILIILGSVSLSVYGILQFIEKNKHAETGYQKFMNVCSLVLIFLLPLAFMFKMQHYPGAGIALVISNTLILVMIPFMIVHAAKETDPVKKANYQNVAIIFIAIVAFFVLIMKTNISKQALDSFIFQDESIKKEIKFYDAKATDLYATFEGAVKASGRGQVFFAKASEVKAKSDSLISYIKSEGEAIMFFADKVSLDSLQNLKQKSNIDYAQYRMLKEGKGVELKNKINAYKEFVGANTNSRGKEIIDQFFNTQDPPPVEGRMITWESERFEHLPLIAVMISLNDYISHIRMLESETIGYLQAMAAKEINSMPEQKPEN